VEQALLSMGQDGRCGFAAREPTPALSFDRV